MTALACRSMPSGWSAAGSFGPRPQPASFRSLRRNSLTCWMGSIGEIPNTHGGLWQQAELWSTKLNALRHIGDSRIAWFVILLLCGDGIGPTARRCRCTEGDIDRSTRQALRRRSADRASAVGNRQNEARCSARAPSAVIIDQLELQLEELAAAAGEEESKVEAAKVQAQGFTRHKATRRNFPADLPRRRIIEPAPTSCPCCGSSKLSKIGEDITETLDVVPRQWFVTEHVREKFSCRACEKITQPPAPFHAIARGFAGPSLLAMMLVDKYANHQPLNRQSEQFACEGIDLAVSTLADHVGAATAALLPLYELIKAHVLTAERLH